MRIQWLVFLALLLWGGTSDLDAQDRRAPAPIVQELFQSETVYPQEKGEMQLRLLSTGLRRAAAGSRTGAEIEYGITNRWQVSAGWDRAGWGSSASDPESGGASAELGLKRSFMQIAGLPLHAAAGLDIDLERKPGEAWEPEYEPQVAFGLDLNQRLPAHLCASVWRSFGDSDSTDVDEIAEPRHWLWAIGAVVQLNRRMLATAEWSARTRGYPQTGRYFTPGVIWRIAGLGEVGVGLPLGAGLAHRRPGLVLSFVREFSLFGGERE